MRPTLIATLLLLTGCAGPSLTAEDVAIAQYQAEAARALSGAPCRATNVYDASAKIAEAQNAAAGQIVGNIATAGIAGIGIFAGADVLKIAVKGAGSTITAAIE